MNKSRTKRWKRIQIAGVDGVPRNLGFQGITETQRKEWKAKAQHLVRCQVAGMALSLNDAKWIASQSDANTSKLQRLGIEFERDRVEKYLLSNVIDHFLGEKSTEVSDKSMRKYDLTAARLIRYFGRDKDIRNIEVRDAKRYFQFLIADEELAELSSAARAMKYAGSFFVNAWNRRLIERNPFRGLGGNVQPNEDNHHYICPEQTRRLWNVIDSDEDRVRFVLLRYLALRAPSEMNELRWQDFDFHSHKVRIRSPKLIKYRSYKRLCPFDHPGALPTIEQWYRQRKTANGTDRFLPEISHERLTDRVEQWISNADLERWPSLLTNFRRTAFTDAEATGVPLSKIVKWYGNSEVIAQKHYLLETDEHAEMLRRNSVVMHERKEGAA